MAINDVFVLLPGILGSRLSKDGKSVWGVGARSIGSMLLTRGGSLAEGLRLTDDDPEAEDLGDGVVADALIPDLHLIPGLWKVDGYSKISREIKILFQVEEGANFFQFPYDWRRYNQSSARRFKTHTDRWLKAWRDRGNPEARLILIAHSMGGLVARYFLEVLGGWRDTRAFITFGTPFRGSLNAVDTLSNGVRKGPMRLAKVTELARSLSGLYQLLPTFECYDDGSGTLVRVGEVDTVPNIDPERAAAALAFHREMREAAEANRSDPEYLDKGYVLRPVVGIRQKTNLSARRKGRGLEMLQSRAGEDTRGDGTVPRMSATPPERGNENIELFASTKHSSLQNCDSVLVDLEGIVTNFQFDHDHWLAGEGIADLALEVEDLYFDSEPVPVRVEPSVQRDLTLTGVVHDSATGTEIRRISLQQDADGAYQGEIPPLEEGDYSLTILGSGAMPVSDAFSVAETVRDV